MRTTRLIAVLMSIVAIAAFAADASANYHPGLGVWMSRDPGPGGVSSTPRVGATGRPVGGSFIRRDQYADGMGLYQYVRGQPTAHTDPHGQAVPGGKFMDPTLSPGRERFDPSVAECLENTIERGPSASSACWEAGVFVAYGRATVRCCDENKCRREMEFSKKCYGGILGVSAGIAHVEGMSGEKCRAESYAGWFLEMGVSTPFFVGLFLDIGLSNARSNPWNIGNADPTLSGTVEGGVGVGVGAEVKLAFCWYTLVSEKKGPSTECR